MPELKHTFTGGRMEKDLDERIVPNGQYREALNIGVATSEDSDVGAAQNILGNIRVTEAIRGRTISFLKHEVGTEYTMHNGERSYDNNHIAHIVDPQSDKLYRFINTAPKTDDHGEGVWMDRIIEYDTTKDLSVPWHEKESAVMIDIYKVKSHLKSSVDVCVNGNKTIIQLTNNENLNQIRWGMRVNCSNCGGSSHCTNWPMDTAMTVEHVNYQTGEILLDKLWPGSGSDNHHSPGLCIWFTGDRNLNFSPDVPITGMNIIDGMLFWTDNHSEPKKIDIERCKFGSDTTNWLTTPGLEGRHSPGYYEPYTKIDDFNQHTILVVEDDLTYDCMKDETVCTPVGCTDPTACNYDPNAVQDDGSCGLWGCTTCGTIWEATSGEYCNGETAATIPGAYNYDPNALCNDGSCCFLSGCTDIMMCGYSPNACHDDGSCKPWGCTDPEAANYDPNAGCDDGTCEYNWSCQLLDPDYGFDGCGDSQGINYDSSLGVFDPSNHFPYDSSAYDWPDDKLEWIVASVPFNNWEDYWYLEHRSGPSLPAGWETNGNCDWDLGGGETLKKLMIDLVKYSDYWGTTTNPTIAETAIQMQLGNPKPVTHTSQASFCAGTCLEGGTWADVITLLRNKSIFDGNYTYFYPAGQTTTTAAVPEVTMNMTYAQVKAIVHQVGYDLGYAHQGNTTGFNFSSFFSWGFKSCGNCSDWGSESDCVIDPNGPFTSELECQDCNGCDCYTGGAQA